MSPHRLVRRVSSKLQRTPVRVAARVPSLPCRMLLLFPPGWLVSTISCQLLVPQVGLPCKVSTCVNHILVHTSTSYHITAVPCCTFVKSLCGASEYPAWRAMPAYFGAARGAVTAVPNEEQSQPFQFTKICRPTAYRASVRNGEVQKLVRLLAAASARDCSSSGYGQLQQSSQSAFKTIKPQQAVEA